MHFLLSLYMYMPESWYWAMTINLAFREAPDMFSGWCERETASCFAMLAVLFLPLSPNPHTSIRWTQKQYWGYKRSCFALLWSSRFFCFEIFLESVYNCSQNRGGICALKSNTWISHDIDIIYTYILYPHNYNFHC